MLRFREADIYTKITGFPLCHHWLTVISWRLRLIWNSPITLWHWSKDMSSVKWWTRLNHVLWWRQNYCVAKPAVDYTNDSLNFPVYLGRCCAFLSILDINSHLNALISFSARPEPVAFMLTPFGSMTGQGVLLTLNLSVDSLVSFVHFQLKLIKQDDHTQLRKDLKSIT